MKSPNSLFKSPLQTILFTGLLAGTLDILSAIYFLGKGNATAILKFVASGAFGKTALEGSNEMAFYGLFFHYFIAFSFTILFFYAYPRLAVLRKNKIIVGLLYGVFVWAVMNLIVLRFTQILPRPFTLLGVTKNMGILMYAIGLPIAWFTNRFYKH